MSSLVINIDLLGKTESIEIGYEDNIYDKVCQKFHLSKQSIDCFHLEQLLDREATLCDTNLTANENIIKVVSSRKFQLYIRACQLNIGLYPTDDAESQNVLLDELIMRNFGPEETSTIVELLYILEQQNSTQALEKLLFHFIKEGKCESIAIVSKYVDIRSVRKNGYTPLLYSILCKSYKAFLYILEMGTEVDEKDDENHFSPITLAAEKGLTKFLDKLIENGAKDIESAFTKALYNRHVKICLNLLDKIFDYQSFFVLAAKNSLTIVTKLLEKGVDVNKKDENGKSALIAAIEAGRDKTAARLINLGADTNIEGLLFLAIKNKCTIVINLLFKRDVAIASNAAIVAAQYQYFKMAEKFLDMGVDINTKDQNGSTLLEKYLYHGRVSEAIKLVKRGASLDFELSDGRPLLHFLIEWRYMDFLNLLLETNPKLESKYGEVEQTPLIFAVCQGTIRIAEKLIKAGANVNAIDFYGNTALVYALNKQDCVIANILIDAGANPDLYGKDSPLYLSIKNYNFDMARKMLKRGANANTRGYSPLLEAIKKDKPELVELLMKNGANPNDGNCMVQALKFRNPNRRVIVCMLFGANDINVNDTDKDGVTQLMLAAEGGLDYAVEEFIRRGADVNAVNFDGENALHRSFNLCVAEKLLEAGADPNKKDNNGMTPIDYSIISGNKEMYHLLSRGVEFDANKRLLDAVCAGHASVVEDLLNRGANVNTIDNLGTPLMIALKHGRDLMARTILKFNPDVNFAGGISKYSMRDISEETISEIMNRSNQNSLIGFETTNWKIMDRLIMSGAQHVDKTIDGETLLMKAVELGDLIKVKSLLNMGANVSLKNRHGVTLTDISLANGDLEMFAALMKSR